LYFVIFKFILIIIVLLDQGDEGGGGGGGAGGGGAAEGVLVGANDDVAVGLNRSSESSVNKHNHF